MTGIWWKVIPGKTNHLHHMGQHSTCHCCKITSAETTALMMLQWGESSSQQSYPCLVARFNQVYHISCLFFFIKGEDEFKCTVVLLRYHWTLCISFFVFFSPHCRNTDITISACGVIVHHLLIIYIPRLMFPQLHHFGEDENAAPQ